MVSFINSSGYHGINDKENFTFFYMQQFAWKFGIKFYYPPLQIYSIPICTYYFSGEKTVPCCQNLWNNKLKFIKDQNKL